MSRSGLICYAQFRIASRKQRKINFGGLPIAQGLARDQYLANI
jgi:hypothetical protein